MEKVKNILIVFQLNFINNNEEVEETYDISLILSK
jgi:hypothetical protein